jgi:hypothetical protein
MVTLRRHKEPVIPWGDKFCSWIGVLDKLGLQPAAMILLSMDAVDLVKGAVRIDCFVGIRSNFVEVLLFLLHVGSVI